MKFINARTGREIRADNIWGDDTVHVAMHKLKAVLGSNIYMWCVRPVSCYEGFGMIAEFIKWDHTLQDVPSIKVVEAIKKLFSKNVKSVPRIQGSVTRRWVIEFLGKQQLYEPVSCAFRYVAPSEYFADHRVDPTKKNTSSVQYRQL